MKNITKAKLAAGIAMLCLPLCGAWTMAPIAEKEQDLRYAGGEGYSLCASETIYYTSKTVIADISTANGAPSYYNNLGLANACGPVAGANVVGFYDKYYDGLITGWSSAYSTGRYKNQDTTYVPALIQTLYTDMRTNVAGPGVSESEFKTGLSSYVSSKGYSINYTSVYSNKTLNLTAFKNTINSNNVALIFATPDSIINITISNGADSITETALSGNHIMVAYGYYEVQYTLTSGATRTDAYYKVVLGDSYSITGYYKVGSSMSAAYTVAIG